MLIHFGEPVDVIFIHIPKTAGMSINSILLPHLKGNLRMGGQKTDLNYHTKAVDLINRIGQDNFDRAFTFSFVRNPYDRLYSWCSMLLGKKEKVTKERFKKWAMTNPNAIIQQSTWFKDKQDKIIVDFIGLFENLENDIKYVMNKLDLPFVSSDLQHRNKSNRSRDYRKMYDSELIDFVTQQHAEDIDYFDYTF